MLLKAPMSTIQSVTVNHIVAVYRELFSFPHERGHSVKQDAYCVQGRASSCSLDNIFQQLFCLFNVAADSGGSCCSCVLVISEANQVYNHRENYQN